MSDSFYYYKEGGGITFIDLENEDNSRHTFRDFGLIFKEPHIPLPEPQTNFIQIPFRDGLLDMSAPFGEEYVSYGNRESSFDLVDLDYRYSVGAAINELARFILGKKLKVILDKDPTYYYIGRCTGFSEVDRQEDNGFFSVYFSLEPYRYSIYGVDDPWLWDPFNFLTDMAIDAGSFRVNGSLTKVISVGEGDVTPTITVDSEMTLEFEGRTYQLHPGTITNFDIRLKGNKENILRFTGNGNVTIDYRGGKL